MDNARQGKRSYLSLGKWLVVAVIALLVLGWLMNTPPGAFGKADAIGYAVCHRIDSRSFHLGERQMPLCVRCSGMYLGALLGLGYQLLIGRKRSAVPPRLVLAGAALLVLAFAIDGLNSYLHLPFFADVPTLYEPSHSLRLLTGSGMGLVIAIVLYPSFNQTVWQDRVWKPAIRGLGDLLVLIGLTVALDLLILGESPFVLYPLAWVSASGVLILLTLVYAMILVILFRRENVYQHTAHLWLPLAGGFGLAFIQIIILSLARFALTGTWDGVQFG